ncbi:MAG: hypothetical protein LBT79_03850 [Elusimicrobiota bacterium]|jgi:hypothetical protein|nr:hypothetical protein [Elusimicrobiota bacterium]
MIEIILIFLENVGINTTLAKIITFGSVIALLIFVILKIKGFIDNNKDELIKINTHLTNVDKQFERVDKQFEKMESRVDVRFEKVENKVDALSDKVNRMTGILETLVQVISKSIKTEDFAEAHSPDRLTKKGEQARKNTNADEIIKKYKDKLLAQINVETLKNPYDIQHETFQAVSEHLYTMLEPSEMDLVKIEAFKHGIPIEFLHIIFQILFRDEVLKDKGINIDDANKK